MKFETRFTIAYSQIYVVDFCNQLSYQGHIWTNEELDSMLCVRQKYIIMSTATSINVPFSLYLVDEQFSRDMALFDHIVECSIHIDEGILVSGDFDDHDHDLKINLNAGWYGVLACWRDLSTISVNGLSGNDSYHFFMWPAKDFIPKKVVKQWVNEQRGIGTGFYK
jgi:hypothetical protein